MSVTPIDENHEMVQLKLMELVKVADDLANFLKVHPADDYHKAAGLLFLYVVSQAQLPPPEIASLLFSKSASAINLIVEEVAAEQVDDKPDDVAG
jgi:hypothetical protein